MQHDSLKTLTNKLREFAAVRDWDQFHSPKNLSMALIVEAAELVEHFQWLTEEQTRQLCRSLAEGKETLHKKHQEIAYELADIFIYLIRIADKLGVDLVQTAEEKIVLNEKKYPIEKAKGSAKKYNEYP